MPYTPKIDINKLKKNGILNESRFFRLLSEENNYVDPKTVKDFYLGLVRLATKELRENGICRLPHMGDLAMVKQKDKIRFAGKEGGVAKREMVSGKYVLKFYPKEAWRDYFSKLAERSGKEGQLDPREKVLGMDVLMDLDKWEGFN